jgi:hypothetical protein
LGNFLPLNKHRCHCCDKTRWCPAGRPCLLDGWLWVIVGAGGRLACPSHPSTREDIVATTEGLGNREREPGRLQNGPKYHGSLQPTLANQPYQGWTHWSRKSHRGYRNNWLVVIQPPLGYKRPPYPSGRGTEGHFLLFLSKLLELSAHPIVTLFFFFNTKMLDVGLLPHSRGLN